MALRLASRQGRLVVFGYNAVTSRIEWIRGPSAQQYAGSPLSLDGSMVMAYYKDGTTSDITDVCLYDPEEGTLLQYGGELNINANYTDHAGNEFTADTQIEVADVEELTFTSLAKPVQKEAAALDLSCAVLAVNYSDGTSRSIDASAVTFEPAAGEILGHMEKLTIRATWKNPATGSDYSAEYTLSIDEIDGIFFTHGPNKANYADGEPFVLTGATVGLRYKTSGDIVDVTASCEFYPENGEIMSSYGTTLSATYEMAGGNQYTCETLLNVQVMTVPISVIGQVIGEDLGLEFTDELPSDFWDDYSTQDVPYIPADGDYFVTTDIYSSIVDYLATKGAFAKCQRYGDIPYMVLPAGRYESADGKYAVEATADIYIIAAMQKKNGLPAQLPNPSCVDYPYTNIYAYNQIQVLTFTLNASDYIQCSPGLKGSYNSATSGICRKMAGLGLYDVSDDSMYTNYVTFKSDSIVNIPGILALPWCWYDDVPHNLATLKAMVQSGEQEDGCPGIRHKGKVPYLTYSKGSVYEEVKEQFPELFGSNVDYGGTEYAHVDS